ncbi:MAG: AgmX/PglI C-terminal domain-containing protein [Polyangiaceae bacterium]
MSRLARFFAFASPAAVLLSIISCGGGPTSASDAAAGTISVDLGELEINSDKVDRFMSCPPVGALGEPWIPTIREDDGSNAVAWREPGVTDRAIQETLVPFRSCYRRGLIHDPTQAGHVAVVVRVAPDGKVADVDTYGACELSKEILTCMTDAARELKFDPPRGGRDSVVIPAAYEPRGGRSLNVTTDRSSYAARAYLFLENARPALHTCEQLELQGGRSLDASGTYRLEIDGRGHVTKESIDPWLGNQSLLACGARALESTVFPVPPAGRAIAFIRLVFDPRRGTR